MEQKKREGYFWCRAQSAKSKAQRAEREAKSAKKIKLGADIDV
jgi:hypothetical protein